MYAAGLYLLVFDKLLRQYGYFHWLILLAYLVVMPIVAIARHVTKKRVFSLAIGVFSLLMFIAQLADAALNLPVSKFKGTGGFSYLFGFGTTPLSSFGTSTAFTLFLVFNVALAVIFIYGFLKDRR